ncbi:hypothetical protein BKA65DRAFT_594322 [Rhexocercosporidium sp. MPI-PUGE-AT-0058]|nr:hypothetical protein BKA65DRAFT_594322 [Rhexocercosporidium sp. MPI-PUGE-AT-0058]
MNLSIIASLTVLLSIVAADLTFCNTRDDCPGQQVCASCFFGSGGVRKSAQSRTRIIVVEDRSVLATTRRRN